MLRGYQPPKRLIYPAGIDSKGKNMTAALGFAYAGGIVLAADTLIAGGYLSRRASKIGGFRFDDGVVLYAVAGNPDMAESAMQQCEYPLCEYKGIPRNRAIIAHSIRGVLAADYKTHVIDNNYANDYSVIVAIHSEVDGIGLYCAGRTPLKRSKEGREIIGSGEIHSLTALKRFGSPANLGRIKSPRKASIIAAYAIGEAKRHQEESVGGYSVILHLERDGMVTCTDGCDDATVEKYAQSVHQHQDSLLSAFMDLEDPGFFEHQLKGEEKYFLDLKDQYRRDIADRWHTHPQVSNGFWDINPVEYLEKMRRKRHGETNTDT